MALPVRERRSARVILFDDAQRILLLRFEMNDPDLPRSFWATPGGAVEAGETAEAAAARELHEELGLEVELAGPVHGEHAEWIEGGMRVFSDDSFFIARCNAAAPVLAGASEAERRVLREMRWWTLEDIDNAAERVFPASLAQIAAACLRPSAPRSGTKLSGEALQTGCLRR